MSEGKKTTPFENCICVEEKADERCLELGGRETRIGKPNLLLHSCCGPCSTSCIERLIPDYEITIFFYNPNITDRDEYEKRKRSQKKFIEDINSDPAWDGKVSFIEGDRDTKRFEEICGYLAAEPEGGARCGKCFWMRLEKTAEQAAMLNFDTFSTTLTVSPHKDYDAVSAIGKKLADVYKVGFLDIDFKKQNGFGRSVELAKKYDLYRQSYCGCEYSKR